MDPAERIPIINRIATRLEAMDDSSEIDFVLEQFGFQIEGPWTGSMRAYVRHA